ncbi:MAG: sulfotransferase [Alphaproteobacteria bacterium]
MTKIDLVFRQIDERTRDLSLELAKRHIRPDNTYVMDDIRPFSACVREMLCIDHDCDYVVYVDADCLILEDMRAFIEMCDAPYVDCYVSDKFRERIHCGVHITRIDLVRRMARIKPPLDDMKYVLRPESRLRNLAMQPMRTGKQFRNFNILHDHFQYNRHIFAKYALRELRSRVPNQRARLDLAVKRWPLNGGDSDFAVARLAMDITRRLVPHDTESATVAAYIDDLPELADKVLRENDIAEKSDMRPAELATWEKKHPDQSHFSSKTQGAKVFGVGLSRTGTRSLTKGLQILGYNVAHYPDDEDTFTELSNGQCDLSLLRLFDGITDITTVPFYKQFDQMYPGSKFILTTRSDTAGWLQSCENHYFNRPAFQNEEDPDDEVHYLMRQFLRAAVYGTYSFNPERYLWLYNQHQEDVRHYFRDRPEDLLIMDVSQGDGFEKLAPFMGRPIPPEPYPHKGNVLSQRIKEIREEARIKTRMAAAE